MSAKVKFLWRGQEFIRAPNYINLFDKHHNNYKEFVGRHWIELDGGQQKHWEKLGCDLCHAFDAARRGAGAGCLLMPVLFELPEPDVPLTGRVLSTKKKAKAKKPYERKASGAWRKSRGKQSAPVEPPVASLPPIKQDEMAEMPVQQYEGLQPFGFPEPIQYPMPLPFDIPQYPMMDPFGSSAPNFNPCCGPQAVMDNIYDETIMRLSPEGPLLPSYPDEIPQ